VVTSAEHKLTPGGFEGLKVLPPDGTRETEARRLHNRLLWV